MTIAHMLWVRGPLGLVERISIKSFLANGYIVKLWTYGDLSNVPEGVEICFAGDVLDKSHIFLNAQGHLSGFSDLFRYALLNRHGGLWVDTDVIAVQAASNCPSFPFFVTDRNQDGSCKINGNVIHHPSPEKGDVINLLYHYAKRFPKHKIKHIEIAVNLINAVVSIYPDHGIKIMNPDFANNFNWWESPDVFFSERQLPENPFIHLYTNYWHQKFGQNLTTVLSQDFDPKTVIGQLIHRYGR